MQLNIIKLDVKQFNFIHAIISLTIENTNNLLLDFYLYKFQQRYIFFLNDITYFYYYCLLFTRLKTRECGVCI